MKKLAGTDLIVLMNAAKKDNSVLEEMKKLSSRDLAPNDILADCFLRMFPGGIKTASTNDIDLALNKMNLLKEEITVRGIRKAHNLLQNTRNSSSPVVGLDAELNGLDQVHGVEAQLKSAKLLNFLSKYVDGDSNKATLKEAAINVNRGNLDQASHSLRDVFARYTQKNIKTAFVTVKQQIGEGYQMCPKAIYQSGRPIPMAISNCREYCIDARLDPDGSVGCNYVKWLNENLITQEQALNLFDKMPNNDSDIQIMNLEKGQRSKFPMSEQDSQDLRIEREEKLTEKITTKSWEEQLDTNRTKQPLAKETKNTSMSDTAIEKLLEDVRDVFDEDDLDTLEQQIREATGD